MFQTFLGVAVRIQDGSIVYVWVEQEYDCKMLTRFCEQRENIKEEDVRTKWTERKECFRNFFSYILNAKEAGYEVLDAWSDPALRVEVSVYNKKQTEVTIYTWTDYMFGRVWLKGCLSSVPITFNKQYCNDINKEFVLFRKVMEEKYLS